MALSVVAGNQRRTAAEVDGHASALDISFRVAEWVASPRRLAAFLVKSLPLDAVRVLVVIVIAYTAATLWRDARRETRPIRPPSPSVADVG
jgi:hypothetical protein